MAKNQGGNNPAESFWGKLTAGLHTAIGKPVMFIPGPEEIAWMSTKSQANPPNHLLAFMVDWTGEKRDAPGGRLGDDMTVLGPGPSTGGTIYVENVPQDSSRQPRTWDDIKAEDVD
jgi:hypothetical protein